VAAPPHPEVLRAGLDERGLARAAGERLRRAAAAAAAAKRVDATTGEAEAAAAVEVEVAAAAAAVAATRTWVGRRLRASCGTADP